ncbi:Fungal specific transcription factor domain containing protein [Elaphomyces granulatus]
MEEYAGAGKSNDQQPKSTTLREKRRVRVQFSCTACRSRKLKCDRTYPCDRCTRRGEAASCVFIGRGPRGRPSQNSTNPTHIQNRIQHLENLVLSFAQRRKQEKQEMPQISSQPLDTSNDPNHAESHPETATATFDAIPEGQVLNDSPGKIFVEDVGTSYVDAAHWRAILEDIKEVKEYFQDDKLDEESVSDDEMEESSGPTLLIGMGKACSKDELLADIPSRAVLDRVISRYFNSSDPSLVIFHSLTFQKEYAQFWANPSAVSLPWLGLLYGCMAMAASIYSRSGDSLPSPLGNSLDVMNLYRKRSAQCLAQSDYTKPGRYKVEALMIYIASEFIRGGDAPVGSAFLLGITCKLAMRMGYHRDSKHYPSISVLEGEIRRRVWALVTQLDALTSFQVGIPRSIQSWQYDTELPHNLLDEDFDERTLTLPSPRPQTERTPVSFTICKGRLMSIFGNISDLAYSRKPGPYDEVLELDKRLQEAHDLMPSFLKMPPMNACLTDTPDLIMRRYILEFLFQKARCVLHRKYLAETRSELRYTYSRWTCINAAKEILRHQTDLFLEMQPGGRLNREKWFSSSLQNHDFVLAAMIICLELSRNSDPSAQSKESGNGFAVVFEGRESLARSLEVSCQIWRAKLKHSAEARKAFDAVTIMLRKVEGQLSRPTNVDATAMVESRNALNSADTLRSEAPCATTTTVLPRRTMGMTQDEVLSDALDIPPCTSLEFIEGMIDEPSNIDWHLWDGQMQDFALQNTNQFWSNFESLGYFQGTT